MLIKDALKIAKKDLYTEWKTKATIGAMLIFSMLVVLVFSFAFDPMRANVQALIPGLIWVLVVFDGMLGLNRAFVAESKNDTIFALNIAPIDASSVYLGKCLANFILLLIVELIAIPFLFLLFDYKFDLSYLGHFILVLLIGTFGFISAGTLLAALSAQTKSAEMILPLLLFPIVSPLLIGVTQATKVFLNSPENLSSAISWIQLVGAYDVIIFAAGFLLYEYIQEV